MALFDPASGLIRAAGNDFSTAGVMATVERRLPGANVVRLSYANGDSLVMSALPGRNCPRGWSRCLRRRFHGAPRCTQSRFGTRDGRAGGRAIAGSRTTGVTRVAPFAEGGGGPYLNITLR